MTFWTFYLFLEEATTVHTIRDYRANVILLGQPLHNYRHLSDSTPVQFTGNNGGYNDNVIKLSIYRVIRILTKVGSSHDVVTSALMVRDVKASAGMLWSMMLVRWWHTST